MHVISDESIEGQRKMKKKLALELKVMRKNSSPSEDTNQPLDDKAGNYYE